jgi:dTDP-4-amino-4,6-dideoxygalactose transaminase
MSVMLSGVGPGDEVIVPSFTFSSTASAVALKGGIPVFVDVDPETLNISNLNGFFWKWEETKASASPTRRGWSCFLAGLEFWSNPIYPIFVG